MKLESNKHADEKGSDTVWCLALFFSRVFLFPLLVKYGEMFVSFNFIVMVFSYVT